MAAGIVLVCAAAGAHTWESGADEDVATTVAARLQAVHGRPGPWAVLGYRAGELALKELGASPHTRTLRIVHKAPAQPQYSCMVDGLGVASGNSLGQLNLTLEAVETTGGLETLAWKVDDPARRILHIRLTERAFREFSDIPMMKDAFDEANLKIDKMADSELFVTSWTARPPEESSASAK